MKIPVKEILEIPILMDLFIMKNKGDAEPYRLLFDELEQVKSHEKENLYDEYEVFFSKMAEGDEGNCFLTLFKSKNENPFKEKIIGEYIYSSNGRIIKQVFNGVLADFVNIFAM